MLERWFLSNTFWLYHQRVKIAKFQSHSNLGHCAFHLFQLTSHCAQCHPKLWIAALALSNFRPFLLQTSLCTMLKRLVTVLSSWKLGFLKESLQQLSWMLILQGKKIIYFHLQGDTILNSHFQNCPKNNSRFFGLCTNIFFCWQISCHFHCLDQSNLHRPWRP